MRLLIAASILLALTGCATQAALTIYSQPPGAYITELGTGRVLGIAPVNSFYEGSMLANYKDAQGCYLVKGFEARWVSGARNTIPEPVRLCEGATNSYNITVSRDSSYPDLEKDLQFAMQVQAVLLQQKQAQAAQDAANAALLSAFTAMQQANTPVRCSSYPIGSTVQTTCK